MKLVNEKTGEAVKIGDKVISFRHESATVTGWEEPRHSGSTGRVYVVFDGTAHWFSSGYYPGVFDLLWEE